MNIAITGATKNEMMVAKFTSMLKSPLELKISIRIKLPTISEMTAIGYDFLLVFDSFLSPKSLIIRLVALAYPSNTAIQVPNMMEKVQDEIMM